MKNKIYLFLVIILTPLAILSKPQTKSNLEKENNIMVQLQINDELLTLPLEDYVIGVVAQEMPASFYDEAIKAQAVAARTFALYNLQNNDYLTTGMQAYISVEQMQEKWKEEFDYYYNKIKNLVLETKDLVLTYNGNLIKSYYYAMSNGMTEDSLAVFNEDLPYIKEVSSIYDNESLNKFSYELVLSKEEFCSKLNISCSKINISSIEKDYSNRVSSLKINNKTFSGIEVRKLLDLRSTDFNIEVADNIIITTKGYGHGVGMSQYGANGMAKDNKNFIEILNHYYQNVEIEKYNV